MSQGILTSTFLHVPRIGPKTELTLWRLGLTCWKDYIDACRSCALPGPDSRQVVDWLKESQYALDKADAGYFTRALSSSDAWRLYADFRERTAFVDIETTGLYSGSNAITVIGLFDGTSTKVFVQGINLEDFSQEVKKYSVLVTFNGRRFDLPFLRTVFGDFPQSQGHIDLMYPLRRLGYRGGLKSIERQIGLERPGALGDVNGYMAVLLWREYKRGNPSALDTLVRYNLEDVVNLRYLADFTYNESVRCLPVSSRPLPSPAKYEVDLPFDPELVEYLAHLMSERE